MNSFLSGSRSEPLHDHARPFALVDVETTGLSRQRDRVVQVAITQVDERGRIENKWHTLIDPQRDPGPTHIHGITAAMLRGAPTFHHIAGQVAQLLDGRVVVAHNAIFDWEFLQNESGRAATSLSSTHRLCTVALARRLDLDLPDLKLPTLAGWAGVRQHRWHNAADDVDTLHRVFVKLLESAHRGGLPLPMARNHDPADLAMPATKAPRVDSPWRSPGPWSPGAPLVQGTKYAITGGTATSREELYLRSIAAGLVPMNSVSGRTGLVVCNDPASSSVKARRAGELALPVLAETTFLHLLSSVAPGIPVTAPATPKPAAKTRGPLAGCRVLVLGGPHGDAIVIRERITQLGGRVAVNLTPTVSHIVELQNPQQDARYDNAASLLRLDSVTLSVIESSPAAPAVAVPAGAESVAGPEVSSESAPETKVMFRGEPWDLPPEISNWELFMSWTLANPPLEIDVVSFVVDQDERVLSDDHFVFFNSLTTPGGEIRLDIDTDGEAELEVRLDELTNPGVRVVVGAVVSGEQTFGDVGPVEVVLRTPDGAAVARFVSDAATIEKSMILAEFYQRNDRWRVRAVGQGYEDNLEQFVTRHGVVVDS